jgi:hypothetical protein
LYRRLINPFKQAVLKTTEQHLFSIPQLRQLPDQVITHIAYAARSISVHPGRLILRHREESNVLVLLAKGEVKVSTPKEALKDLDACVSICIVTLSFEYDSSRNHLYVAYNHCHSCPSCFCARVLSCNQL